MNYLRSAWDRQVLIWEVGLDVAKHAQEQPRDMCWWYGIAGRVGSQRGRLTDSNLSSRR